MTETRKLYRYILYVNILFDTLGWSMMIPALPQVHDSLELSTIMIGSISSCISLFTFLSSTLQGKMTEYCGNRIVLLLSPISQFLANILLILALQQKSIILYTFGRCLPACFKCGMIASQALLYDLSSSAAGGPEKHDENIQDFGILFAFSNLAYIIGPILGGYLYSFHSLSPFVITIVTSLGSIVLLQYLPLQMMNRSPSLTEDNMVNTNNPSSVSSANKSSTSSLSNPFLFYYLHIKFAFQIGLSLFETFFALHSRNAMKLSSSEIGVLLSTHGALSMFTNLYLVNKLVKFTGSDHMDAWFLPLIALLGTGLYIWSKTTSLLWYYFGVLLLGITGNLFQCVIQNRIASTQDQHKKGRKVKELITNGQLTKNEEIAKEINSSTDTTTPTKSLKSELQSVMSTPSTPRNLRFIQQIYDPSIDPPVIELSSPSTTRPHSPTDGENEKEMEPPRREIIRSISGRTRKLKTISTVFGLSAAADRAARIISPFVGSFFLQSFESNGLLYFSAGITIYCAAIICLGPPLTLYGFLLNEGSRTVAKTKQE